MMAEEKRGKRCAGDAGPQGLQRATSTCRRSAASPLGSPLPWPVAGRGCAPPREPTSASLQMIERARNHSHAVTARARGRTGYRYR